MLNLKKINEELLAVPGLDIDIEIVENRNPNKFLILKMPQTLGSSVLTLIDELHQKYESKIIWIQTSFKTEKESFVVFDKLLHINYAGTFKHDLIYLQNQDRINKLKPQVERMKELLSITKKFEYATFEKNDTVSDLQTKKTRENLKMIQRNSHYYHYDIDDLPLTAEDYERFTHKSINIVGEIIFIENRPIKKGILVKMKVTNFRDTISVSGFVDEPLAFKVGDTISINGLLRLSKYSGLPEVQITSENIPEACESIRQTKQIEKFGRSRIELNVSTKFSNQDAVSSIEDYYKLMDDYELKAIGVADHENLYGFPHSEGVAQAKGVKMPYGVKMSVLDNDSFKVFYKGTTSTNKTLVGIDIETTGLSNQYDDITEISAYKEVNGELLEYSVLVQLDDYAKLRPFIIEKTSITPEMLQKEGIPLKEALQGFVDFAGDGILVAHNGTFDKDFLEVKIEQVLGIKKDYDLIDTMNLARVNYPEKTYFDLEKVAKMTGVKLEQHHRAVYDAICCYQACLVFLDKLATEHADKCSMPTRILKLKASARKPRDSFNTYLTENDFINKVTIVDESKEGVSVTGRKTSSTKVLYTMSTENLNDSEISTIKTQAEALGLKVETDEFKNLEIAKNYEHLNDFITDDILVKFARSHTVNILVKTQEGLKNLYKLISKANTKYVRGGHSFVTKELLEHYHQGLLYSLGGINSEFRTVLEKGLDRVNLSFYDFIEIHPVSAYYGAYEHIELDKVIKEVVTKIVEEAEMLDIPVLATSNAYYTVPELKEYRKVLTKTLVVGGGTHYLYRMDEIGDNHLRTTKEMVSEIRKYGFTNNEVEKFVFDNVEAIYNSLDDIKIIKKELCVPKNDFLKGKVLDIVGHEVPDVIAEMRSLVSKALENYSYKGHIPKYVSERAERELKQVIDAGYYVTYYLAYLLVKKSNSDGYVVGSRGSVGSSFVANLMGITEVNALVPHYVCPKCHFSVFQNENENTVDQDARHLFVNLKSVKDGFDLPRCKCPKCQTEMLRDGHDIPFETFLGFNGDKVPDIDLNFSGEYQAKAMEFIRSIFGKAHAFRVGTISTIAEDTAIRMYKSYLAKMGLNLRSEEVERRSQNLLDIKRTTGQHAGGVLVVPKELDIFDFTPVQYPANDVNSDWMTTHYEYHGSLEDALLKLDILGHDDPTILKFLMDLVKENPERYPFKTVKEIPLLTSSDIQKIVSNSTAISELGTNFVKGMLNVTKPSNFGELVKVSGLSHGTDVYNNNAEALVSGTTEFGKIPFSDVIGCRDDIMVQLLDYFPEEPKVAFDIMEFVRKGKAQKDPQKWSEYASLLKSKGVPEWYIWSCSKIQYMFPKAHAVAYVHSALRIAWFKLYRPLEFWSAYFSIRSGGAFGTNIILSNDVNVIQNEIDRINGLGFDAPDVDKAKITFYEGAIDAINAGITFAKPHVNKSLADKFVCDFDNNRLILPFSAVDGVGSSAGEKIVQERNLNGPFTRSDFLTRTKAGKKIREGFDELGVIYK